MVAGLLGVALHAAGPPATAQEAAGPCASGAPDATASSLRDALDGLARDEGGEVRGETLASPWIVVDFYRRRGQRPAWIHGASASPCALAVVERIGRAGEDGLAPDHYHAEALERLVDGLRAGVADPEALAALELLLTDGFLTLATELAGGRVDPVSVGMAGVARRAPPNVVPVLETALITGAMRESLLALRPAHPEYERLVAHLARLREVAARGGWDTIPGHGTLRPGDVRSEVAAVRGRLEMEDRLEGSGPGERAEAGSPIFGPELAGAVARFQRRYGLVVDSAVGPDTRAALNVPVEERIAQISVNLERWRWLPDDLGRRHLRVNVPFYEVEFREDGFTALVLRAVVGRTDRQTPPLSAEITHLVLAPFWHVPPGIARLDELPALREDPGHLARQHMVLLDRSSGEPVDPGAVDFRSLSGPEFNRRYRLRQDPGPTNALGQVKFVFPNPFDVAIHDTPDRHHFARVRRAGSSGCVRVERPLELAAALLAGDPDWPPGRIRRLAGGRSEVQVGLAEPVPVHLLYWTALADEEGRVHFRPDIYGRDARLLAALEARSPAP